MRDRSAINDHTLPLLEFGQSNLIPPEMRKHMGPRLSTNATWPRVSREFNRLG